MVTDGIQRRNSPACKLARIQELATNQQVVYESSRVELDVANLNYSLSTVCDCICALTPDDFEESVLYPGSTVWYDVYKITYIGVEPHVDSLYIKFTLSGNCLLVVLFSFHRDR
jgi:hypothetical protein